MTKYVVSPEKYNATEIKNPTFQSKLKNLKSKLRKKNTSENSLCRNPSNVYENYQNSWGKYYDSKAWLQYNSLYDYCFPKIENGRKNADYKRQILLQNKLMEISRYDWYLMDVKTKLDYFKNFLSKTDVLVELGCGIGRNIFGFYALGFLNKMEGYEYTKKGFETCNAVKDHFNLPLKFGQVDLTKDFTHLELKGKTIFTSHVIENIKYDTESVIENILNSKPKQVIHFEPMVELAKSDSWGNVFKNHIKTNDYQESLFTTLTNNEKAKKLEILETIPNPFAMNHVNQTTIVHWKPN